MRRIRIVPKGNNLPTVGQGLVETSVHLFIFKTKVGSVSKDMQDRAREMSTTRIRKLTVGRHGKKSKREIAELFTYFF